MSSISAAKWWRTRIEQSFPRLILDLCDSNGSCESTADLHSHIMWHQNLDLDSN